VKPWIAYTLLRLGLFAGVFTLLMISGVEPWLSAVIAAILGFAISYVFFSKLRDAVALSLAASRERPSHDPDRDAEDAAADLESNRQSESEPEEESGKPGQAQSQNQL